MSSEGQGAQQEQSPARSIREGADGETSITLELLDAVHRNNDISQRLLASDLGIALGLTNLYLRRCVQKGLVKVKSTPANRYAYYLTPKGFTEKSRLTARYLSRQFDFYRHARGECDTLLERCDRDGWNRIALYGLGDLAEIALLCSLRHSVAIAGVVQPQATVAEFLGVPVAATVAELADVDGVMLTEYHRPQHSYQDLVAAYPAERVLVPEFLRISLAGFFARKRDT